MAEQRSCKEIEAAAERLVQIRSGEQSDALEQLALTILEHHGHPYESTATSELFSRELPGGIRRFAAAWLVRILTKSSMALHFGNTERLAGSLFDRVFQRDVYPKTNIESRTQTFEKLPALADHLQSVLAEADGLTQGGLDLHQLNSLQQRLMRLFNGGEAHPFLLVLLSRRLINDNRISSMFKTVKDYANNDDADPMHLYESACDACDEFEGEARAYGTTDANNILGGLARRLKSAVASHFDSLEAGKRPRLHFSPIAKKYPLERTDTDIVFKVRITNDGTGPARELRLDEVVPVDDCLQVQTESTELGTIQAGDSVVLDIDAKVVASSDRATLLAQFSWVRLGHRSEEDREFQVVGQREDVDWGRVELTEPYSTEPVTSGDDLIGRKGELTRLLRLASLKTVGSGFIYGQKRVGKTSLANAVEEILESQVDANWVVINKGSGDYVGDDASSTLRELGNVLVYAMKRRIPGLESVPTPDFANGLAPLSGFVDQALLHSDMRLFFILDEFDDLPSDLFARTALSASLFQPLRQIGSKRGCGFLLVGGENMRRIMDLQGDRLNKFRTIELEYFSKSSDRSDFVELVRRPVQDWLTIGDEAVEKLFMASAGNPYFAKLVAAELFYDMVGNRYSDASEIDMEMAINRALVSEMDIHSFAHYWHDDLIEAPEEAGRIRIIRKSVLIAAGRVFRNQASANNEEIWKEFKSVTDLSIGEQRFRSCIDEFVRRKVLNEDRNGRLTAKIPLFQAWLQDKGVRELLEDSREIDEVRPDLQDEEQRWVRDEEIGRLCEDLEKFRFRGTPVSVAAIRRWLNQFDGTHDQRLMFHLLSRMRFYDERKVREKMDEAFGIVTRNMRTVIKEGARVRRDILVSSLDESPAKAGASYCRLFASENRIAVESVRYVDALREGLSDASGVQRLVFIDDFAGTGRTLVDGLRREMGLLRRANERGIRIIVIAVVGFGEARRRIERFIERNGLDGDVYFCDELGPEDQAFSEMSTVFQDPGERDRARQVAEAKGAMLEKRNLLGYGDTQAMVVFYQSCPNNTLPIVWSRKRDWEPLFARFP